MGVAYFSLLFFTLFNLVHSINGKCLHDQLSYLLGVRGGLLLDPSSQQFMNWNHSVDCCEWDGVECNVLGRVVSLELSGKLQVSIRNENWKAIFSLQHLEKLNLAGNDFAHVPFPVEIYNLTKLRYLNLSGTHFSGQIPIGLSKLNSLATLDLSQPVRECSYETRCKRSSMLSRDYLPRSQLHAVRNVYGGMVESIHSQLQVSNSGGLKVLFQNSTELREVYLDWVDISAGGSDWFSAFSHMSKLQVLSLRDCDLPGHIFPALSNLSSLTTIQIGRNPFSTTIPDFFANLTRLRNLDLSWCDLQGQFPKEIFQIPTLESLKASGNQLLEGSFPDQFFTYRSLRVIRLESTNFSGSLPDSISYLGALSVLDLGGCNFSGPVSDTLANLSQLVELTLYGNRFSGSIPATLANLSQLVELTLYGNRFSGSIPATLANLSELVEMRLENNQLTGPIPPFQKSPKLDSIDLSDNSLSGKVSSSLLALPALRSLSISNNNLDGWMTEFPNASSSSLKLEEIDLSLNVITGEIPNWLWNPNLRTLDLSSNLLSGIQKPFTFTDSIEELDLHSNMLKGEIPLLPAAAFYVDYSNNNLNSSIPSNIGYGFDFQPQFFSLSNNSISGGIPESICNLTSKTVLDFSYNFLRGVVPECICTIKGVLNLRGNKLSGHIPDAFRDNCDLETLDLSENAFIGKMPLSLVNCKSLQVVNVGGNYLEDHFPCKLIEEQSLRVVVLRSNRFHGEINCHWNKKGWRNLQILDVSYNNFSGTLPPLLFLNCRGIMVDDNNVSSTLSSNLYYQDTVNLVIKGNDVKLENILSIYKTLDFSCNGFQGKIPEEIARLRGLFALNLSHNALTGTIPGTVGNLFELNSLDLSRNRLTGKIPSGLGNLTFLSVLNLSYNQLEGKIPNGRQLQTFSESSFLGNKGLCDFPLSSCDHGSYFSGSSSPAGPPNKKEIDWQYVRAAVGFSVGLGIILLLNFLNPEWWQNFNAIIIRFLVLRVFCVQVQERQYRNPIRRL